MKDKGVTAIITGERGEKMVTKYGLEEYVADCVIILDHRIQDQVATRRIKILKYRGSMHGANEYPFLISDTGISVLPITSLGLDYEVTTDRILSGFTGLDSMLDNKGFYKGSSILLSGTAGTGKTSMAAMFVDGACRNGLKCLYFAFEEAQNQIIRNMKNIGIDLQKWVDKELLEFSANRPTHFGVEMHLLTMHNLITTHKPDILVLDAVSNLIGSGVYLDVKAMLTRLLDHLKVNMITTFMTDLSNDLTFNNSEVGISSLIDTWIKVANVEKDYEIIRKINIIKSRGMKHSHEIKEFSITTNGLKISKEHKK